MISWFPGSCHSWKCEGVPQPGEASAEPLPSQRSVEALESAAQTASQQETWVSVKAWSWNTSRTTLRFIWFEVYRRGILEDPQLALIRTSCSDCCPCPLVTPHCSGYVHLTFFTIPSSWRHLKGVLFFNQNRCLKNLIAVSEKHRYDYLHMPTALKPWL